jgi:hypothetical protein
MFSCYFSHNCKILKMLKISRLVASRVKNRIVKFDWIKDFNKIRP